MLDSIMGGLTLKEEKAGKHATFPQGGLQVYTQIFEFFLAAALLELPFFPVEWSLSL